MLNYGVFASRWPLGNETVWTIVNSAAYDIGGAQMNVPLTPGMRYFDLYHGVELKPTTDGQHNVLSFAIEASGYGAILATPGEPSEAIKALMKRMAAMTQKPLPSFSHDPVVLAQRLVDIAPTKPAADAPDGMVRIPGGTFDFKVEGVEIEGGGNPNVDVRVSVGGFAAAFPRACNGGGAVLHRQVSGDQRAVQEVSRRHTLRAARHTEFSSRLEERNISIGMGKPAGNVGFA